MNPPTPSTIRIDDHEVAFTPGQSVLDVTRKLGLDIPTLCYLEKCGPQTSCLVCLVKINGKLVPACGTKATQGMLVESETSEIHDARRTALELLFSDHVGDCLSPCHRLCPLGLNIPVMLRQIQAGELAHAVVTVRETLPLPAVLGRLCHHPCEQGCRRGTWDSPAAIRDLEQFVVDWDYGLRMEVKPTSAVSSGSEPRPEAAALLPHRRPASGKSVVIIGTGPTGLAAAWQLLRDGHACTLVDRHESAGGTLRSQVTGRELPRIILDIELAALTQVGAQYKLGIALGPELTLEGLQLGFDAVLLAPGEISKPEGEALGLAMAPGGIKVNSITSQTDRAKVFAAGRAVKPISHLVKAMAEGVAVAGRINQYLLGKPISGPTRPFSNVMGRLDEKELNLFMQQAEVAGPVKPRALWAGFSRREAATEASRCLHCDCRSSGDCGLQRYAEVYDVNPSRFRQQRPPFEQTVHPGGVIFESGKCIRCGICVKLTELAGEPLGLAFVGRGFNVKVAAPFHQSVAAGLQIAAAECVEQCPTGALACDRASGVDFSKPGC